MVSLVMFLVGGDGRDDLTIWWGGWWTDGVVLVFLSEVLLESLWMLRLSLSLSLSISLYDCECVGLWYGPCPANSSYPIIRFPMTKYLFLILT